MHPGSRPAPGSRAASRDRRSAMGPDTGALPRPGPSLKRTKAPMPSPCSAAAASPSAPAWAVTFSAASCRRRASSSMTGGAARCSMKRYRSSPLPGLVRACTTTASTTPSTGSSSFPGQCGSGCLSGARGSLSRSGRAPATTASSRSTLSTPASSPRPPPPSPACASTRPRPTTSRSRCRPAPTQRPMPRRAPPGGSAGGASLVPRQARFARPTRPPRAQAWVTVVQPRGAVSIEAGAAGWL